ncbi:hypothetical protein ACH429_07745 [Streptomyces pathocidini]|uniref:Uncharacterized protein n=1 Tax=Streptomyces pathocidini TaxID=1650571 RepID=A0ABW7UMY7_9ACTN|nr:hypothetical protein [Streptomyces pathocidini]
MRQISAARSAFIRLRGDQGEEHSRELLGRQVVGAGDGKGVDPVPHRLVGVAESAGAPGNKMIVQAAEG